MYAVLQTCGEILQDTDTVSIPFGPFLLLATLRGDMHMQKTHIHACAYSLHMYAPVHTHNTHAHTHEIPEAWKKMVEDTLSPCRYRSQKPTRVEKLALGRSR